MLLLVYSPNFCMNYGTMVNGVLVELRHDFQLRYGTMILELRLSMRLMVHIPVELWYDGHRVAVVYESHGKISKGAMAQCS